MHLLIRADASIAMGTGHVMRCLALAQAWRRAGGEVTFLSRLPSGWLADRLAAAAFPCLTPAANGDELADADETLATAARLGAEFVVADGYHFGADFQRRVHGRGVVLLVVDDHGHAGHYFADLILNQNLHAESATFPCAPQTRLLLGPRFALLREEFWGRLDWQRAFPDGPHRLLVSLGGSDPDNVTGAVLRSLVAGSRREWSCRVLVGGANPHAAELAALAAAHPGRFELLTASTRMPDEMAAADVAISGGGSTCWELAFMGLPSLVITLADNQADIGPALHARGVAVHLGWPADLSAVAVGEATDALLGDAARRAAMSRQGRALVDGRGAWRVVESMLESRGA